MKTLALIVLIALTGCATAAPVYKSDRGGNLVATTAYQEPWYRWLYCGAFGSAPCLGPKPTWVSVFDALSIAADGYNSRPH